MDKGSIVQSIWSDLEPFEVELRDVYRVIHSDRNIFRFGGKRKELKVARRRTSSVLTHVRGLGELVISNAVGETDRVTRWSGAYWCEIYSAALSLAEISSRVYDDLVGRGRFPGSEWRANIALFRGAIDGAQRIRREAAPMLAKG